MHCKECGNEIMEEAAYCPYCGSAVGAEGGVIRHVSMKCKECGGTMQVDEGSSILECPYCGSRSLLIVDQEAMQEERQLRRFERLKAHPIYLLLMGGALLCAYAGLVQLLNKEHYEAGTLFLIQALCFALAWFVGMNRKSAGGQWIVRGAVALALVLFVPLASVLELPGRSNLEWSQLYLSEKLPPVKGKYIDLVRNTDDCLDIYIRNMKDGDFYDYVRNCKEEYGFTVDAESATHSFTGFNQEGYRLYIYLNSGNIFGSKEMELTLSAPVEVGPYTVPSVGLQVGLPEPVSKIGYCDLFGDSSFSLLVANTTKEECMAYAQLCMEAGFDIDAFSFEDYYSAENEDGYELTVEYVGFNIMEIYFSEPWEE